MKVSRTELSLVGCFLASLASLLLAGVVLGEVPLDDGPMPLGRAFGSRDLLMASMTLQGVAVLACMALVVPRLRSLYREGRALRSLTGQLTERSRTFEEAAHTDPLTGLKNRRYFDEALKQFLLEFAAIGRPVGLLVLDLDHFKSVNDTYGHDMGDEVLKAVAGCLDHWTRHHDVVARLGGEEFAIVVPNMAEGSLVLFAERIRVAVSRLAVSRGSLVLRVTVSMGLVVARDGEEGPSLVKRADEQLYRAKRQGRDRVCA